MAEPARKASRAASREPDPQLGDDESGVTLLLRYVERPDGSMEEVLIPLTPEDYLNPRYGDKWLQGELHSDLIVELGEMLGRHFRSRPDVKVLKDVAHRLGPGLPKPSPDISIIQGVRNPAKKRESFDLVKEGVAPSLILEIISPKDRRIREVDEVDKVALYARAGIPEYLVVDPPRKATEHRFQLTGHRRGADGRYRPIEPDAEGFLLSETTGLRFGVSPAGDRIVVIDARTGERLRTGGEEEEARKAAEEKAARESKARRAEQTARKAAEEKAAHEAAARKVEQTAREVAEERAAHEAAARRAAEEELRRLRAEIERLKTPPALED